MRKPREPKTRKTNLLKRFDKINLEYFGGLVCGGIGWRTFPLSKKEIDASYQPLQAVCVFDERLIKVSSIMDDSRVPLWYLDFVVYHEMLHLQHGPQQFSEDGYGHPHSIRFMCMEQKHPDYRRAIEFEQKRLWKIFRSWQRWAEWKKSSKKKKSNSLRLAAKRR